VSDDPSLVDTATLLVSMRNDIAQARAKLIEAWRWLDQANVTAWELEARARSGIDPPQSHPGRAKGGKARAAKLTAERRSEIARAAAKARWAQRAP
jgi:hypothetical protein